MLRRRLLLRVDELTEQQSSRRSAVGRHCGSWTADIGAIAAPVAGHAIVRALMD